MDRFIRQAILGGMEVLLRKLTEILRAYFKRVLQGYFILLLIATSKLGSKFCTLFKNSFHLIKNY